MITQYSNVAMERVQWVQWENHLSPCMIHWTLHNYLVLLINPSQIYRSFAIPSILRMDRTVTKNRRNRLKTLIYYCHDHILFLGKNIQQKLCVLPSPPSFSIPFPPWSSPSAPSPPSSSPLSPPLSPFLPPELPDFARRPDAAALPVELLELAQLAPEASWSLASWEIMEAMAMLCHVH